jgi:multidrug efflux system outer membrane protein
MVNKTHTLIILLISAMASACASVATPYEKPALPVKDTYSEDISKNGLDASTLGWHDYFSDPRLQSLIAQALDNNRDLRIAALRVEESRAIYGIQRADQYPTMAIQAGIDRSRTPADLSFTGQKLILSQYQVDVGVSTWEIDFWGRIRSLKEAALQNYLASDEARRAVMISIITQVANSDMVLREIDERIVLTQKTIATRQESLRIFTRRVEVGATSRFDLTQVQTLLSQAQSLGTQLIQDREAQLNALTLLVGSTIVFPADKVGLSSLDLLKELSPGIPSELLINRPDIIAAEDQLKASNANISAARAAFFPQITLTGFFGSSSAALDGLFASGSHAWQFFPSISLPIFDGGRRNSNLDLTEVRRNLAVANYEKTVQNAFRDVSDALSARRWLDEQIIIAKVTLATQSERARLSMLRYNNGASSYLEVLDAERDLLAAEQQLVQTRRSAISSRINLYAALGGGSRMTESASKDADPMPKLIKNLQ